MKRVESGGEGLSLPPNAPLKGEERKRKKAKCASVCLHGVSHGSLLWKTTPQSISPSVSAN